MNHYGITIEQDTPVTGVIANNAIEWLHEEIETGINLDWEDHVKNCNEEYHDSCWESNGSETVLIGDWKLNTDGKYEPVEDGPHGYAAIVSEIYTQVVWSIHTTRAALCSPCFPGQADLDEPDPEGQLAYTLPADLIGNNDADDYRDPA